MQYNNDIKYCLDTSAFITMHRYYPESLIPDLWTNLEMLFNNNNIISHEIVFNEIVPRTGNKDWLAIWIDSFKIHFLSRTQNQVDRLSDILRNFPKLIDTESEKEQADPWLISMLVEIMENEGIFGSQSSYVMVTTESEKSPKKLPAACRHYNIRHMNLFEFFNSNGFIFNMGKTI
jgi:hypothetical protein